MRKVTAQQCAESQAWNATRSTHGLLHTRLRVVEVRAVSAKQRRVCKPLLSAVQMERHILTEDGVAMSSLFASTNFTAHDLAALCVAHGQ